MCKICTDHILFNSPSSYSSLSTFNFPLSTFPTLLSPFYFVLFSERQIRVFLSLCVSNFLSLVSYYSPTILLCICYHLPIHPRLYGYLLPIFVLLVLCPLFLNRKLLLSLCRYCRYSISRYFSASYTIFRLSKIAT